MRCAIYSRELLTLVLGRRCAWIARTDLASAANRLYIILDSALLAFLATRPR